MPLNNPGVSKLSQLDIDADVNWGGHTISNIGIALGADVDFNQHQALQFVVQGLTSDPASPVDGQIWLRTDL